MRPVRIYRGQRLTAYIDATDLDIMARTIYGEARGESQIGRIAVGWVIRNRAEMDLGNDGLPDWWGEGIKGVCQRPWQFSCWNQNDPNRAKLLTVTHKDAAFKACLTAARDVLLGSMADPTGGATHYHTASVAPPWAKGLKHTTVGRHRFYKDVP